MSRIFQVVLAVFVVAVCCIVYLQQTDQQSRQGRKFGGIPKWLVKTFNDKSGLPEQTWDTLPTQRMSSCSSSNNSFISNPSHTRHFLFTSTGTVMRTPFITLLLQVFRYCEPGISSWPDSKVQQLNGTVSRVKRSFRSTGPRSCDFHVLVDNITSWDTLGILADLALGLPDQPPPPAHTSLRSSAPNTEAGRKALLGLIRERLHIRVHMYDVSNVLEHSVAQGVARCMNLGEAMHIRERAWMSRVFLSMILPPAVPTVLSLDMDTLVLSNLDDLFCSFEDFKPDQAVGMTFEMVPANQRDERFQPFRTLCPGCQFGKWDTGYPGFNGGVMLAHLDHMRTSKRYKEVMMGNFDGMCAHMRQYNGDGRMCWGDQDLYTALALVFPELFYVLPCEWNYQTCWAHRHTEEQSGYPGCRQRPRLYHGNCGSKIPETDFGLYYVWTSGVLPSQGSMREEAILAGDERARGLKPSAVGGPIFDLEELIHRQCSCIKPYI